MYIYIYVCIHTYDRIHLERLFNLCMTHEAIECTQERPLEAGEARTALLQEERYRRMQEACSPKFNIGALIITYTILGGFLIIITV